MFCARCGQQIPEESATCPLCGQETTLKLDPVAAPAPEKSAAPYEFVTIPHKPGPSGIKGWLLLYCLSTTILGPVLVVMPFLLFANALSNPALLFRRIIRDSYYVIDVTGILYGAVVGITLWMRRASALQLLGIYFIFLAADILLGFLRLISILLKAHATPFQSLQFYPLTTSMVFFILWLLYFRKSERVRNTYGRNL